jgi:hypothetical protein
VPAQAPSQRQVTSNSAGILRSPAWRCREGGRAITIIVTRVGGWRTRVFCCLDRFPGNGQTLEASFHRQLDELNLEPADRAESRCCNLLFPLAPLWLAILVVVN